MMYTVSSLEFVMQVFTFVLVTWFVRYPLREMCEEWYERLKG